MVVFISSLLYGHDDINMPVQIFPNMQNRPNILDNLLVCSHVNVLD